MIYVFDGEHEDRAHWSAPAGKHKANERARRALSPHRLHAFDCHQHTASPPQTCAGPTGAVAEVHPHGFRCQHCTQHADAASEL